LAFNRQIDNVFIAVVKHIFCLSYVYKNNNIKYTDKSYISFKHIQLLSDVKTTLNCMNIKLTIILNKVLFVNKNIFVSTYFKS